MSALAYDDDYQVELFDHVQAILQRNAFALGAGGNFDQHLTVEAQVTKILPHKRSVRIRFQDPSTEHTRSEVISIKDVTLDRRDD